MSLYALVDSASRNVLGEFETREEAEALYDELVTADRNARKHLNIFEVKDEDTPAAVGYLLAEAEPLN